MSDKLINYQCPACGGALSFDSTTQSLKCPFCESTYDIKEFSERVEKESSLREEVNDDMLSYTCQSCGGEIITDINTGATICPYCGSKLIVAKQFEGEFSPDEVIPFHINKKEAMQFYKDHVSRQSFVPHIFLEEGRVEELTGVYVPFWVYDAKTWMNASYRAEKSHILQSGDERMKEVDNYLVDRTGEMEFYNVPIDASVKMDDDLMDSVEPFDFMKSEPFQRAYLAGYSAMKYDVPKEDSMDRLHKRLESSTSTALQQTVTGYTYVSKQSSEYNLLDYKVKYMLLPVWMLHIRWNDTLYTFAINGETGRTVGELPYDAKLYWIYVLKTTVIATIIIYLLYTLLGVLL